MSKKVYIVYSDNRIPGKDIANITGNKSYGDTIYKRVTLREHMKKFYEGLKDVEEFVDFDACENIKNKNHPVILFYSDVIVKDEDAVQILITKALYAHEPYRIVQNNKIAGVIFEGVDALLSADEDVYSSYEQITVEAFTDISDVTNFRAFITGGFEARFFNSLKGDEYTLIKSSDNVKKLKAEHDFYYLLPDEMKQWFVRPFDYKESDGKASYKMQRFHMTDLAIRYIHGSISMDEFMDILDKVFYFVANRVTKEVDAATYEAMAQKLYVDKVAERIEMLKGMEGYPQIASLLASGTDYESIDAIFERYKTLYGKIRDGRKFINVFAVGHGDLCFSNILYSYDASLLLLIDPKGGENEADIYMDPYYDIAKLSHSICGHYDFLNSDLYEINVADDLKSKLLVYADNRAYVEAFKGRLCEMGVDFRLVRLYEASLFISMLPLHMDRPKKVYAFILNAIAILDSLEE